MTNELKPCPFCGSKPVVYDGKFMRAPRYGVGCETCGFEVAWNNEREEAISIWNTRAKEDE